MLLVHTFEKSFLMSSTKLQSLLDSSTYGTYFTTFQFLCRVAEALTEYLGGLTEDLIKDNFVIVYEVGGRLYDLILKVHIA